MKSRDHRASLLAPSFLIVTAAWGCGETLSNTDAEPGSEVVTTGGASFEVIPKCPASVPATGSRCQESQRCEYPEPDPACFGLITNYQVAECADGVWTTSFRYGGSCNPPGPMPPMPPATCPAQMPALGSACPPNYSPSACSYQLPECSNALVVVCTAGTWQSRDVCAVTGAGGFGQGGSEPGVGGAFGDAAGESGHGGAAEAGRGGEAS